MFTGTLIEDLIAVVERVEAAQANDTLAVESLVRDAWFASVQENPDYNSILFEAA